MNRRIVTRLVCTLAAAAALGCTEDYNFTEPVVPFDITPTFASIDEGATTTVQATQGGSAAAVTWSSDDPSIATVSGTGVVTGVKGGTTAIIAKLTADPSKSRATSITVVPVPELVSGTARTGLSSSGARGSFVFFKVIVPAGKTQLRVQLSGGTGDADLFVRLGSKPTASTYTCSSEFGGNDELCVINNPAAGTYFVGLMVWDPYSGATLRATVTP